MSLSGIPAHFLIQEWLLVGNKFHCNFENTVLRVLVLLVCIVLTF